MINETVGTVASATAVIIFAPCRMMPCRSTALPIMNPGTSAKYSRGMLNASHCQMKRAPFIGRIDEQHSALDSGLVRHDADHFPLQQREASHQLRSKERLDLEKGTLVHNRFDDPADVVASRLLRWYKIIGEVPGRVQRVVGRQRASPVQRQVGEILLGLLDRLGIVSGQLVPAS